MTGAKALFCLTAGKTEEENGRMEDVLEDPTVGLDDMTGSKGVTVFSGEAHRETMFLNIHMLHSLCEKLLTPRCRSSSSD